MFHLSQIKTRLLCQKKKAKGSYETKKDHVHKYIDETCLNNNSLRALNDIQQDI